MKTVERYFELNNHENGWGYVRPGKRPRHHRQELRLAKSLFGMEGDRKHWWLPVLYKPRHLWEAMDAGVLLPEFIPLAPGQRLGDAVLEYEDYAVNLGEGFKIKLLTRFPEEEDDITPEAFPAYWGHGRRRKL
jgi:hypothetical protein